MTMLVLTVPTPAPMLPTARSATGGGPRFLFSGLMKCGVCGGGYSKISTNPFGCSSARNKGTCDNRLNVRLEASVLNGLKHHLMDPAPLQGVRRGALPRGQPAAHGGGI
jgi:hypothetical protein